MFILYLLLSVLGSIHDAIISISLDRPSVCGCWLAETCLLVFCRLVGHAGVLAGGCDFAADFRIYWLILLQKLLSLLSALVVLFTFDVSVTSIWEIDIHAIYEQGRNRHQSYKRSLDTL